MRENITFFENFDVLLFKETNCISKNLPNGIKDLELDGFYEPFVQDPIQLRQFQTIVQFPDQLTNHAKIG